MKTLGKLTDSEIGELSRSGSEELRRHATEVLLVTTNKAFEAGDLRATIEAMKALGKIQGLELEPTPMDPDDLTKLTPEQVQARIDKLNEMLAGRH